MRCLLNIRMAQKSFRYHSCLTISYQGPICSQVRDPISQVTGLRNFPCRCLTASCLSEDVQKTLGTLAGWLPPAESKLVRPIPIWVVTQAARLPGNILETLSLYNSKSPRFLKLVWLVLEWRPFFWLMSSTIAVRNSDKSH